MSAFDFVDGGYGPLLHPPRTGFRVERLDYSPADLLLRLSLRVWLASPPAQPMLLVEREARQFAYSPLLWCTQPIATVEVQESLWRGAFAVPAEVALEPGGRFALDIGAQMPLMLGHPLEDGGSADRRTIRYARRARGSSLRRGALIFAVACQLGAPAMSPASAFADGSAEAAGAEAPQEGAPAEAGGGPQAPAETPTESPETPGPRPPAESEGGQQRNPLPRPPVPPRPPATPTPVQSEAPAATAPSGAAAAAEPAPASPPASSTTPASSPGHVSSTTATVRSAAGAAPHHRPATPDAGKLRPKDGNAHHQAQHAHHTPAPRHSAPPAAQGVQPALTVTGAPAVLPEIPWALQGRLEDQPPSFLIPIYKEAGLRYHVPWTVLAAINQLETDYGRDLSVSSAGAIGWMQFMPTTWREWAVDADGDALADPYSPRDAIFTAARYLQASGAESDLTGAIYAYNHAGWYVTAVLFRAATLDAESIAAPLERGYSLPLDPTYLKQLGRTDDGVDIETAPDGSLVYSITPGVVSAVASDPAGFGPNYPVVEATSGALAGQHIYYGHVARALVQPGDHVAAGQPIAVVGHTGDAVSLGHGHIEIGFSDAAGAPLDQHGAVPSTPAGEIMRSFLIELAARFGIHTY